MPIRTALLMNFVAPYRLRLLEALQARVGELRVFVSTKMEADRPWVPDAGALDIVEQKTKTIGAMRHHPAGFEQRLSIHFPYDTLSHLRRYAPRVVISGEMGFRTLQAAIYRLWKPRTRLIIWATLSEQTERGWGFSRRLLRRLLLKTADAVICNGPSGGRYVAKLGFPPSRIFIVNQPVDVKLFAAIPPVRAAERAYTLVYSGRLLEWKGLQKLQIAVAGWAADNPTRRIELLWIGDGEDRAVLEAADLPPNVTQHFVGSVPYAALPELYAHAGALILPSMMDEWGLVVNEAMLTGLVVLGSIFSQAVVEMVTEGETGWKFDPSRAAGIRPSLDAFFATPPDRLAQMRLAARERGLMITPESAADRMYAAVRAVLPDALGETAVETTMLDGRPPAAPGQTAATLADRASAL